MCDGYTLHVKMRTPFYGVVVLLMTAIHPPPFFTNQSLYFNQQSPLYNSEAIASLFLSVMVSAILFIAYFKPLRGHFIPIILQYIITSVQFY